MLNVVKLSVVMLNAVMLNVVAPSVPSATKPKRFKTSKRVRQVSALPLHVGHRRELRPPVRLLQQRRTLDPAVDRTDPALYPGANCYKKKFVHNLRIFVIS